MSETAQQSAGQLGTSPDGRPSAGGGLATLRRGAGFFVKQREVTVFVVAVALFIYFMTANSNFLGSANLADLLSQTASPIIIIALGEVFLLISGEIDLSVGFIYTLAPYIMYFLHQYYGVPGILAVIVALVMGIVVGWINGFLTVAMRLPSFITTLGTGFVLLGIVDTTSHAEQVQIPTDMLGYGTWLGNVSGAGMWSAIIWAVVLTVIMHFVLTRTRWGLHTIAAGGNLLGAQEVGINVRRIKYGNFMITGLLGALTGLQGAYMTQSIDPTSGGYTPMFYAVAASVVGGTAMLGGVGTIIGAFFGAMVIALLLDGFLIMGVSANPLPIIFGAVILVAMIANVQLTRLRERGRT